MTGSERTPPHAVKSRALFAVALVVVALAALSGAGLTVGEAAAANTSTVEEPDSEWSADELRRGGSLISGAAPSQRWLDESGSVYIDYPDPNPLAVSSGEEWESGVILAPGSLVESRQLTINAQRPQDAETGSYDLRVVYWDSERVTVETDDGTVTTEERLTNVTTDTHEVEFSGSFDQETVTLRRSGETRQVTMWLEDDSGNAVGGARWNFEHRTAATAASAGIDSMGDLLGWVAKWIAGPLVLLTVVGGFMSRAAIKKAGTGPDKGLVFWGIMLSTAGLFAVGLGWFYLADWLVALPLVIPVALAAFSVLVILETYESGVERVEFIKPEISVGKSPSGELSLDTLSVSSSKEKIVRQGPEGMAVVRSGIRPFLARCFGGTAPLEGAGQLSTRIDVDGSRTDAKVWVHPKASKVLQYEPERWELDMPAPSDRGGWIRLAVTALLVLVFSGAVWWTWGALAGALTTALLIGVVALRPVHGYAKVDVAPAHVREAFITNLYHARELDDADTISAARTRLVEKEARSEKDVEKALTERDETLLAEMHSVDVSDVVSDYDGDETLEDVMDHEGNPRTGVADDD